MKGIYLVVAVIIVLSVLGVIALLNSVHNYRLFTWDGERCLTYYKDCTCIGQLLIMESYPPQYSCQGIESCQNINETQCEFRI